MKIGKQSIKFNNVYLKSCSAVVGPYEKKGPLKDYYDFAYDDLYCGESNWEDAEARLLKDSIDRTLEKAKVEINDIDYVYCGDLLNQNVTSNYVLRDYKVPFFGIYNACATSCEGMILGAISVDSENANNVLTGVASHNATAERQYRYPTEYGGQKPITATFTVTGSGTCILSKDKSDIQVTKATVGRVIDANQKNPFDMGSAMAPAASDTIKTHLEDFNITPSYYDLIVTGDLSKIGAPIVKEILKAQDIDISNVYDDCGLMVYDKDNKEVFAGGSGCGCSAVVMFSYIVDKLKKKEYKKVLVVATGALLNPIKIQQKESIPCIAHAICLESVNI